MKYAAAALRVERAGDGGLSLAVQASGAERVFEPAAVVVATSAPEAVLFTAPALVAAERDGLAEVRYQPALSLALGLRRPFFPHPQYIQLPHSEE